MGKHSLDHVKRKVLEKEGYLKKLKDDYNAALTEAGIELSDPDKETLLLLLDHGTVSMNITAEDYLAMPSSKDKTLPPGVWKC
jgi:hypothetical protein